MKETVVVGFDDGEPSRRALEHAVAEARKRHARLAVIAVLELPLDPGAPRHFGTLDDGPVARSVGEPRELGSILSDARAQVEAADVKAEYLWATGDPARTIVDLARERAASLIVVGAHHEGLFSHFLTPGIDEQVRHDAGCDVVVVP